MPRRRATAFAPVLVSVLLAGALGPAAAASASVPPDDVLAVQSQTGGSLAWWWHEQATAQTGLTIGAGAAGRDEVVAARTDPDRPVELRIVAPPSAPRLTPGRYAIGDADVPGTVHVALTRSYAECDPAGTVDVLAVSRDAAGELTGAAVDLAVTRCEGAAADLHAALRWRSDVPYAFTRTEGFDAGDTPAGRMAQGQVTVTNAGTAAQTYGATFLPDRATTNPATPVVTRDGCAGRTLAAGEQCTVDVQIPSDGVSSFYGVLQTPDQSPLGYARTRIGMRAVPVPLTPSIRATPQRGGIVVSLREPSTSPRFRVLRSADGVAEAEVAHDVAMPWTDTGVVEGTTYTYRAVAVTADLVTAPSAPATGRALPVPVGADGELVPIDPVRVLDTRSGVGGRSGPLGPRGTLTFDPTAGGHVPRTGVSAVILNVTGTEATEPTHVRVWPAGDPLPGTSSLNLVRGQTRPNQVIVPLGEDGRVALYNDAGRTHLIVDVQGYYSTSDGVDGALYHPIAPTRELDTRVDRRAWYPEPVFSGETIRVYVDVPQWWPERELTAVDVNITVTEPQAAGHLVVWDGTGTVPGVSNVNFAAGQTVANHAVVPVRDAPRTSPSFAIHNGSERSVHVIVDVQGWYDDGTLADGLRFRPSPTARVADTRTTGSAVAVGSTLRLSGDDLPPAVAHVVNVTATRAPGPGQLVTWSGAGTIPTTSAVNYARDEDSPNIATIGVDPDGRIALTAQSSPAHVVVDHLGYFY
ncbi:hypothetical protein OMK64_02135 [Cellulomonas fimi]|uniref:hypothetical protein n=1 Tax=Cellulomonas fimi TaxID=1708 RepID=UPI00234DC7CE|nr:hypothetical protein [Cellulomonas fimi]MDC7120329.1 hypothetical protein [Cellulomonas fimi]